MQIKEVRSLVMSRAVVLAKRETEGTWRERISAALKSVWSAFKEATRIAALPLIQAPVKKEVPDKIMTTDQILIHYRRMCYNLTGEVTPQDIKNFEQLMLHHVIPTGRDKADAREGRTKRGHLMTRLNLTEVLTDKLLRAQGRGIWTVVENKGTFEFTERDTGDNLSITGVANVALAWGTLYSIFEKEERAAR